MPNKLLVIDTSGLMHSVKHSLGGHKLALGEKSTFVIFGFINRLNSLAEKFKDFEFVFALDSRGSVRSEMYPGYKVKRKTKDKTPEEKELDKLAYPQFDEIIEHVLPTLGYQNLLKQDKYEADDIIGSICLDNPNKEICLATTDKDMYQLLSDNVYIFNTRNNSRFTASDFINKYGISPERWWLAKCYFGCTSDSVLGIPLLQTPKSKAEGKPPRRCGEGTALNYMKDTLNPDTLTFKSFLTQEARDIMRVNKKLVKLPFKGTQTFKILRDNRLSAEGLISLAKEYGFKSILMRKEEYIQTLGLKYENQ